MFVGKAKRVLRALGSLLATLLLALSFSYLFTTLSDSDPVDSAIRRTDPYFEYDRNTYLEKYQRISKELGYDEPPFYYQIRSKSLGSLSLESLPLKERNFYTHWSAYFGEPEGFYCFYHFLENLVEEPSAEVPLEDLWETRDREALITHILALREGENIVEMNCMPSESKISGWALVWRGAENGFHRLVMNILGGHSFQSNQYRVSVWKLIARYSTYTALLSIVGIILVFLLSYWGSRKMVVGKSKVYSLILYFLDWVYAMPVFWLATLTVMIATHLLVSSGWAGWGLPGVFQIKSERSVWEEVYLNFTSLFWPLWVIVWNGMAYFINYMVRLYQEEANKLYVQALLSKGWSQKEVYTKIISKRVLYSLASLLPRVLASMISGSVVLEVIFNIPGMGFLLWVSLKGADWPVVHAVVLLTALLLWTGTRISRMLQNKWSLGDGKG
jgi:ABC-type dipeptide/oligopeptide/nickel transport system permease component